ncbi:preprotein translocase subunit SecG [Candidatus Nomurabacteria bacterium RIFCSPLOWO2_01_FULL_33_17]|uniref:Protein-export membrane protein SecG n=1 Tax=Candidatus Nomurabacteria bacterium RIFCSPLOWO2_01_FULL_33_17 TaxID=1801764 RepID=A0A1F6WRC2_9BACT|nr:MAG: preprotein translocase subunit SecG [Candidatus Nomurabacteria bacterium RIFCSPLOWO2_01_FULL_33_17]
MELVVTALPWTILGIAILIVVVTLLQQSDASLGSAFGGGADSSLHRTRRGFEKFLFILTIILGILFAGLVILSLVLKTS